ncbi:MAG TPA: MFS transporter [Pirellulaceae bacterium]|nr:MFS transporter [Pirellulaceae bacterium]
MSRLGTSNDSISARQRQDDIVFRELLSLPRVVLLLCFGSMINRAGTMVIPFLAIYLADELKTGEAFATLTLSAFGLGSIAAQLIGGSLADRIGRRPVLLLAFGSSAAILPLLAEVRNPYLLMVGIFLFAIVAETYRPATHAMIADVTPPEKRSDAFGLMYVAVNLGFAIAAGVGGLLAESSFRLLFWIDAATCGSFGLLLLLTVPETRRAGEPDDGSIKAQDNAVEEPRNGALPSESDAARPTPGRLAALLDLAAYRRIVSHGDFIVFCAANVLLAILFMQSVGALPLSMTRVGLGKSDFGQVVMLNGLMICLLQLGITKLVVPRRRSRMLIAASLLVGFGFFLNAPATLPWHFAISIVVWTIGEMMQAPLVFSVASTFAPAELRGRYMGFLSMSFSIATVVGPATGGLLLERLGPFGVWGGCLAVGIGAALLFARIAGAIDAENAEERAERERREREAGSSDSDAATIARSQADRGLSASFLPNETQASGSDSESLRSQFPQKIASISADE